MIDLQEVKMMLNKVDKTGVITFEQRELMIKASREIFNTEVKHTNCTTCVKRNLFLLRQYINDLELVKSFDELVNEKSTDELDDKLDTDIDTSEEVPLKPKKSGHKGL
jgi:hypothetical protein